MLRSIFLTSIALLLGTAFCASGEEWYSSKEHHPWGRFPVGSWKRVRLTTDQIDSDGKVLATTVSETTTTLISANDTCYTLRVDVVTRNGNDYRCTVPRYVRRYFGPELNGQVTGDVILREDLYQCGQDDNKKSVSSEVRQITYAQNGWKRTTRIHFSPKQAPFVLRRSTSSIDDKGNPTYETLVQASDVNVLKKINGVPTKVANVSISHKQNGMRTLTNQIQTESIPGFVVSHLSLDQDLSTKQVTRRSKLELIDYHIGRGTADFESRGTRGLRHRRANRLQQRRRKRRST